MTFMLNIQAHQTVSNLDGSWNQPAHTGSMSPDIGLRIARKAERDVEFNLYGRMVENDDGNLSGQSYRTANEIVARSDECRQKWFTSIVGLSQTQTDPQSQKVTFVKPFQDIWDHADNPHLLATAAPELALAGNRLFMAIFETSCDEGLKEIGKTLRALLASKSCRLAITSSEVFLPWSMLYTHPSKDECLAPNGANWRKEGFWGYQHLIHQNPVQLRLSATDRLDPATPALLSVNFDDRLAESLKLPMIDKHIKLIGELVSEPRIRRTRKAELANDFTLKRESLERILYFYCHGKCIGSDSTKPLEPHLILPDGEINAADFEYWSEGDRPLPTSPLIFINACQGGQMQTLFYQSFAVTLLKQGAIGLIGAQIDVPALFAAKYGEKVFREFLTKGQEPVRMGPLLQKVNRTMWDDHNNPLGLVYSLYRGVNCFIDWQAITP